MPVTAIAPASAFTPPQFLATMGDASPQAELDRLSTGTSGFVSLRADPHASATAPVPALSDANRAVLNATGLGDDMGSWLSSFLRSPIAAGAAAAIPGVGPALSTAITAYQGMVSQGVPPAQAAAQVQQQQGLTAQDVANMIAASQAQQKPATDYTKLALIGGGVLAGVVVLASVLRR